MAAQNDTAPQYFALDRVALQTGVVEIGEKFRSTEVPGRAWKPIDKEAKAAVKARDASAEAVEVVFKAGDGEPDPRIAELEAELETARAEIADLTKERDEANALIAAFDGDGDGRPGGSKPADTPAAK